MSTAAGLSGRSRLLQVVSSLAARLPDTHAILLGDERFASGRAALERLAREAQREAAVAALSPVEAAWLAGLLLERWQALGDPLLLPFAELRGPDRVVAGEPVRLVVAVDGAEGDWSVAWPEAATPQPSASGDGAAAVVVPQRTAEPHVTVSARIHVNRPVRTILVATWQASVAVSPPGEGNPSGGAPDPRQSR
jgi:hypothetical protein